MHTLPEIAEALGIKYDTLYTALKRGDIFEPKKKISRFRIYTEKEFRKIKALVEVLGIKREENNK